MTGRVWKNLVEMAYDSLAGDDTAGDARQLPLAGDHLTGCEGCRWYLGDGNCGQSLELECRDGNYEAFEAR